MKQFLTIAFLVVFSSVHLCAQEKEEEPTKIKYNPFKTSVEDQDDIWEVFFGSALLMPNNNSIQANKLALNVGINYFYEINFSPKKRFAAAIGLGYNYQHLKMDGLFNENNENIFIPSNNISGLSNPRLNVHSLSIPFELRLKLPSEFKVYLGYNVMFPLANTMKYKVDDEEFKKKNSVNTSTLHHGPSLRIGYKDFFLFSRFQFSSFFESPHNLNLFSFGISLGG